MKRYFWTLGLIGLASGPAWAQNDGAAPANTAPAANVRPVIVDDTNFAALATRLPRAGSISLGVSGETLDANPAAREALARWVSAGNVVFLHTGAADFF